MNSTKIFNIKELVDNVPTFSHYYHSSTYDGIRKEITEIYHRERVPYSLEMSFLKSNLYS